jgi:hypothetical protein
MNPSALPLLEKCPDQIYWKIASSNPGLIPLLEKNMDKIDWKEICMNENAMHLICKIDYEKTKRKQEAFRTELIERIFDPDRISRISKRYDLLFQDYLILIRV